jgi:hypothetical protein
MCSSGEPHYHTCCDDHEDHAAECRNMSCYCYPSPARYRNGEKSHGHSNGWHEDGRGAKKKKKLGGIWDESETKEREKLKDFWLGLGDSQRQSLLRIEKESILREMREQQRHICSCSVCGRRRTVLEEELELLYDAYYSELEDRGDSGEIDIEMIDYQSDEVDLSLSLKGKSWSNPPEAFQVKCQFRGKVDLGGGTFKMQQPGKAVDNPCPAYPCVAG